MCGRGVLQEAEGRRETPRGLQHRQHRTSSASALSSKLTEVSEVTLSLPTAGEAARSGVGCEASRLLEGLRLRGASLGLRCGLRACSGGESPAAPAAPTATLSPGESARVPALAACDSARDGFDDSGEPRAPSCCGGLGAADGGAGAGAAAAAPGPSSSASSASSSSSSHYDH